VKQTYAALRNSYRKSATMEGAISAQKLKKATDIGRFIVAKPGVGR
jgi:hypothetical protein